MVRIRCRGGAGRLPKRPDRGDDGFLGLYQLFTVTARRAKILPLGASERGM